MYKCAVCGYEPDDDCVIPYCPSNPSMRPRLIAYGVSLLFSVIVFLILFTTLYFVQGR